MNTTGSDAAAFNEETMLMDETAEPARYRLTRPEELPPFDSDESADRFATAEDREETRAATPSSVEPRPTNIRESEPGDPLAK